MLFRLRLIDLFSGWFASAKVLAICDLQESGQMNWCAVRAGMHNPIDRRRASG
jgi:hypothetical protein